MRLFWNYVPLHPYKKENPESNRRPLKIEKEWGSVVLQELIDMFQVDTLVAIGNEAHQ